MATITEDYVSFETAKLLKEKNCPDFGYSCIYDSEGNKAQTQSIIMKWLREVHKLHISILWDCGAYIGKNSFCYHIDRINNYEDKGYNKIGFDSNEQACEAAIKYCLEHLI